MAGLPRSPHHPKRVFTRWKMENLREGLNTLQVAIVAVHGL